MKRKKRESQLVAALYIKYKILKRRPQHISKSGSERRPSFDRRTCSRKRHKTRRSFRNDVAIADAVCALSTEKFSLKFDLSSSNEISMENVSSSGKHRRTVALRERLGYQTSIRAAMDPIRKSRPFERIGPSSTRTSAANACERQRSRNPSIQEGFAREREDSGGRRSECGFLQRLLVTGYKTAQSTQQRDARIAPEK